MKERAPLREALETGAIGQASVDDGTPLDPHRMEEEGDRAGGMQRRCEGTTIEDACLPSEEVEDRNRERDAAFGERLRAEQRFEARTEERPAKESRARSRIPEIFAAKRVECARQVRSTHSTGPRPQKNPTTSPGQKGLRGAIRRAWARTWAASVPSRDTTA